jgi:hypothetical protein
MGTVNYRFGSLSLLSVKLLRISICEHNLKCSGTNLGNMFCCRCSFYEQYYLNAIFLLFLGRL